MLASSTRCVACGVHLLCVTCLFILLLLPESFERQHLWFFEAFAEHLQPTFTVLLDVGTMPQPSSIYRLLRSMTRDESFGGVCGEISVSVCFVTVALSRLWARQFGFRTKRSTEDAELLFGSIDELSAMVVEDPLR